MKHIANVTYCKICSKKIVKIDTSQYPAIFCSYSCYQIYLRDNKTPNCKCANCGKPIYVKPYVIKNRKHGVCCSFECDNKHRKDWFRGENNHQYGLKGPKNSSFKSEKVKTNYGYYEIYCPNHPFKNSGNRVKEHRLVVEANYKLFDIKYFCEIDGKIYLKPSTEVHHINEIKTDNRIENLIPLTKGEHIRIHNNKKMIIRDELGRIVSLIEKKQEEVS